MDSERRGQSEDASFGTKDPVEAANSHEKASRSILDAPFAGKELLTDRHNGVASWADAVTLLKGSNPRHSELQESENLAWMDMMLALLEKRYGFSCTLPVSLTDPEAAKVLKLSHSKHLQTGSVSAQASLKRSRSVDDAYVKTAAGTVHGNRVLQLISSRHLQQQQAITYLDQESEQTRESKRQRLALRHAQEIQTSSVASSYSCGCKTGCLKICCTCFSSRGFCHAGCACDDCKNIQVHKGERVDAIRKYLIKNPHAFSLVSMPRDGTTTGFLHLLPQKSNAVALRRCLCKKSKCKKQHCECFQHGNVCTSHCRCMSYSNTSEALCLQTESSAPTHAKCVARSDSVTSESKAFHPVQITVTKQPRRNNVGKTLRLNL
ncbi:unnamed protein product [Hyaloperonospora brassicae]|uniref:CRC domain-containing protein n=1 Tax=Hyaloperonospora brassicae TaxID=162125 RepID=A0AAV0U4Z0_HYABA|nr:unnamed protein product [Hyaloperonospora brassicae]CAI5741927.1 unnamed protein product [Hyaloperonospora brassicae]